jgi:hypothetical protein
MTSYNSRTTVARQAVHTSLLNSGAYYVTVFYAVRSEARQEAMNIIRESVMRQSVISQLRVKSIVIECIEMITGKIIVILQKAVLV